MKKYLSLLVLSISIFIPNILCMQSKIQNKQNNNLRRPVNLSRSKRSNRPKNDKAVNCLNIKHKHNRAYKSTNFRTNQNSRSLKSGLTRLSKGISLATGGAIVLASFPVFLWTSFLVASKSSSLAILVAPTVVVLGGAALLASPFIMYGLFR